MTVQGFYYPKNYIIYDKKTLEHAISILIYDE